MEPVKKLSDMGGILKTKKSAKKIIDELRSEWDEELEEEIKKCSS